MLAPTLWAAALLPALAIAAPSPSPLANPYEVETTYTDEPTDTTLPGIYFGKKLTLGPQADYLGVYGSVSSSCFPPRRRHPADALARRSPPSPNQVGRRPDAHLPPGGA